MSRATKVRWAVAVFCALGLAINYIDRSAISVSLPFMTQDLSLTPTEKGLILSAFSWSYALMQIPAGRLIDKFGERVMFGASVLGLVAVHRRNGRVRRASQRCSAYGSAWA